MDGIVAIAVANPRVLQGAFDKSIRCTTCEQDMRTCEGHFGHVELELPVFHIGYLKATLVCLQRICKVCQSSVNSRPYCITVLLIDMQPCVAYH
jgi:DNA-directed RNA polymerase beta' subunit